MSHPVGTQTILTSASHPQLERWSSLRHHSPRTKRCAARYVISRHHAMPAPLRARRAIDNNADVLKVWPVHSPARSCSHRRKSEPGSVQPDGHRVLAAVNLSRGHLRRAPSLPHLPSSPSITRSALFPRPAAHRVLLFLDSSPNQIHWVPAPENAPSALGAGHIYHPSTQSARAQGPRYSRRFA